VVSKSHPHPRCCPWRSPSALALRNRKTGPLTRLQRSGQPGNLVQHTLVGRRHRWRGDRICATSGPKHLVDATIPEPPLHRRAEGAQFVRDTCVRLHDPSCLTASKFVRCHRDGADRRRGPRGETRNTSRVGSLLRLHSGAVGSPCIGLDLADPFQARPDRADRALRRFPLRPAVRLAHPYRAEMHTGLRRCRVHLHIQPVLGKIAILMRAIARPRPRHLIPGHGCPPAAPPDPGPRLLGREPVALDPLRGDQQMSMPVGVIPAGAVGEGPSPSSRSLCGACTSSCTASPLATKCRSANDCASSVWSSVDSARSAGSASTISRATCACLRFSGVPRSKPRNF
jgi:hypothetical protein